MHQGSGLGRIHRPDFPIITRLNAFHTKSPASSASRNLISGSVHPNYIFWVDSPKVCEDLSPRSHLSLEGKEITECSQLSVGQQPLSVVGVVFLCICSANVQKSQIDLLFRRKQYRPANAFSNSVPTCSHIGEPLISRACGVS